MRDLAVSSREDNGGSVRVSEYLLELLRHLRPVHERLRRLKSLVLQGLVRLGNRILQRRGRQQDELGDMLRILRRIGARQHGAHRMAHDGELLEPQLLTQPLEVLDVAIERDERIGRRGSQRPSLVVEDEAIAIAERFTASIRPLCSAPHPPWSMTTGRDPSPNSRTYSCGSSCQLPVDRNQSVWRGKGGCGCAVGGACGAWAWADTRQQPRQTVTSNRRMARRAFIRASSMPRRVSNRRTRSKARRMPGSP